MTLPGLYQDAPPLDLPQAGGLGPTGTKELESHVWGGDPPAEEKRAHPAVGAETPWL